MDYTIESLRPSRPVYDPQIYFKATFSCMNWSDEILIPAGMGTGNRDQYRQENI